MEDEVQLEIGGIPEPGPDLRTFGQTWSGHRNLTSTNSHPASECTDRAHSRSDQDA
jgi:hypothetical protein